VVLIVLDLSIMVLVLSSVIGAGLATALGFYGFIGNVI
jgi:hypothetical protein